MSFPPADLAAIIACHPNKATATLASLVTLDGIYINPSRNAALFNASISGTDPVFTTRTMDVTANSLDISSSLTVNGIDYIIVDTDHRNDGMTGLQLQKDER